MHLRTGDWISFVPGAFCDLNLLVNSKIPFSEATLSTIIFLSSYALLLKFISVSNDFDRNTFEIIIFLGSVGYKLLVEPK